MSLGKPGGGPGGGASNRLPHRSPLPLQSPAAVVVFETLVSHGATTRAQIAEYTALSPGAVTKAVRPLLASGHVIEGDHVSAGRGRPTRGVSINAGAAYFVGVKIAADLLSGTVIDLAGRVAVSEELAVESSDAAAVTAQISVLVDSLIAAAGLSRSQVSGIGIGCSGQVEPRTGIVRFSPFLQWRDVSLAELVRASTGLPCVVDNDVRALAAMERTFGVGRSTRSFIVLSIGQGVGCGICIDGAIWSGAEGAAGEIGHVMVTDEPIPCYCGSTGCLERLAADADVAAASGAATIDDVIARAAAGDAAASQALDRAGAALGRGVVTVVNIVGPDCVVLTGERLLDTDPRVRFIADMLKKHAYGSLKRCEVVVRQHSFDDWARGAAVLALRDFVTRN